MMVRKSICDLDGFIWNYFVYLYLILKPFWGYFNHFSSLQVYLCKFGYLEDGGDLVDAIKEFQRFVRVKPTGKLLLTFKSFYSKPSKTFTTF